MEAQRRRCREIAIDMVDEMEAPEPADAMREHVPEVERVVHEDHGERRFEPGRQRKLLQDAPAAALDDRRQGRDAGPLGQLHGDGGERGDAEIARIVAAPALDRAPQRIAPLQRDERRGTGHDQDGAER